MYIEIILTVMMILFLGLVIAKLPTDVIRKGKRASGGIKYSKGKKRGRYAHRHKDSRKKDSESKPQKRKRSKSTIPYAWYEKIMIMFKLFPDRFGEKEMPVKVYKKKGEIIQCGEYQLIAGEDMFSWTRKNGGVIQVGDDGGFVDENGNVFGSRKGFISHQKMMGKSGSHARSIYHRISFWPRRFIKVKVAKLKQWATLHKWKSEYMTFKIRGCEHRMLILATSFILVTAVVVCTRMITPYLIMIPIVGISINVGERVEGVVYAVDFAHTSGTYTDAELQACVDYCASLNYRHVYLGRQGWAIANKILIPLDTKEWIIEGYNRTLTVLTSTVNGDNVIETDTDIDTGGTDRVDGIILKNFSMQGGGSELNGIYLNYPSHRNPFIIDNVRVDDMGKAGIYIYGAYIGDIRNSSVLNNGGVLWAGIQIVVSNDITIIGTRCMFSGKHGLYLDGTINTYVVGSSFDGNNNTGLIVRNRCWNNTISSSWFEDNSSFDLSVHGTDATDVAHSTNVIGNWFNGSTISNYGIVTQYDRATNISGNSFRNHVIQSIRIGLFDSASVDCIVSDNFCEDADFIELTAGSANATVKSDNRFNGTTTFITDAGVGTNLATISFQFSLVSGGATQSSRGILINSAGETASATFKLPTDCTQVVSMDCTFQSGSLEAHAMVVDILIQAGAIGEAYNTHETNSDAQPSETTNFAINDILKWRNTDATVIAISGGDSGHYDLLYRVATGEDAATNGRAQVLEIRYI